MPTKQCLLDYTQYHHSILLPALDDLEERVEERNLRLHQAIGLNMVISHALDYLLAIECARGNKIGRKKLMEKMDKYFSIAGGKFVNGKFQLIDAVNNSVKHINLDANRYEKLVTEYGPMSFRLLTEVEGSIFFVTRKFKFDYGRVVLRNVSQILNFSYDEPDCILALLDGENLVIPMDEPFNPSDPATAIDRMISHCNPECKDCGELELECNCDKFVYGVSNGEFCPHINQNFDCEAVMREIGSSWR